ncbi:MAG: hypothetical protein QF535_03025, partial [Anaerolineales bacterium]|nr:hypothetical protein [Anaerolineales bacterium]
MYGSTAAGLESSITSTGVITPQMSSTGLFTAPGLAEGGIATRPTPGIFGEAGPEALIPLDKLSQVMGSMGGGGSNVEINIIGAPEGTRVEESESEQGGRSIDVILDEKMSQQVKPGSKFNNQMLSQFRDMQQSTIRR